ncbi:MAG TPA: transposase, partial [Dermatophilaceae bacterium]
PSSVTVIREADGRYYASFVVEVADTPLPQSTSDVGIDLGLVSLAVLSTGEVIENPRYLRRKARALARPQKSLARKTKGSKRRAKAVRRVAVQHRKVRDTRLDAHHKLAHRIVRDNQAIYVEDLAVSGLARTRLAKSVADAGWSMLVRLLEGEGVALPPGGGAGQSLVPLEPALLGVWGQLREEAPGGQVLDLHRVWHHPRSGPERRQEHPG